MDRKLKEELLDYLREYRHRKEVKEFLWLRENARWGRTVKKRTNEQIKRLMTEINDELRHERSDLRIARNQKGYKLTSNAEDIRASMDMYHRFAMTNLTEYSYYRHMLLEQGEISMFEEDAELREVVEGFNVPD